MHAIHHRDGFLSTLWSRVNHDGRYRLVAFAVFCGMTEVIVATHQEIAALGIGHCKGTASRVERNLRLALGKSVVKQIGNVVE